MSGPNPTDRGKLGSKIHLITDRNGLPLSLGISGANMHDSLGLEPLVRGIPPIRSPRGPRRRRPAKLHGDKGYDYDHLRRWLWARGITPRIARKGVESSQRLGRHRWVVERTVSWLAGCRRLPRRAASWSKTSARPADAEPRAPTPSNRCVAVGATWPSHTPGCAPRSPTACWHPSSERRCGAPTALSCDVWQPSWPAIRPFRDPDVDAWRLACPTQDRSPRRAPAPGRGRTAPPGTSPVGS